MSTIYGQDHILRELDSELAQNRLSHAYLLVGAPHIGKMSLALHFAKTINCLNLYDGTPCQNCNQCIRISNAQHPDVCIETLGTMLNDSSRTAMSMHINQIRDVLHRVNLSPFESSHKIIIFEKAELLNQESGNALLLTLEEPPPNVVFFLLTDKENAMLSTIHSRCRKLQLHTLPKREVSNYLIEKHHVEPSVAEQLARLSQGCLGSAINSIINTEILIDRTNQITKVYETSQSPLQTRFAYASEIAETFREDRASAKNILFFWQRWWRDLLLVKIGTEDFIFNLDYISELRLHASSLAQTQVVNFLKCLEDTISHLDRNVNARLAMEVLMLNLPVSRHIQKS